jgi:segregation and condensation protein A
MAAMSESAPAGPRSGWPGRFPVEVDGFSGTLEELVLAAQRGDVDLHDLPVAQVTTQVSRQLTGSELGGDLRDAAEALGLLARLLSMKAAKVTEGNAELDEEEAVVESEAGRRLAEYRLFRAAMEALLLEPAETGERSFLGLVAPEVLPLERLRIPPDRLAAAFRQVLERLQEGAPPVGMITFSVEEKVAWLVELLGRGPVEFEAIFAEVTTRLEAVACFLALLELLKRGLAVVDQPEPFGPIWVRKSD